jgi:hypothetical protein
MFYDEKIKIYGELNYKINKKYCEKYNLDIILSNTKKYNNRHSAWERLPLILEHILNFDYVIWIDADAFFYNDANNIIDVINKNTNVNFIFSKDIGNNNINSGVFIVKNSQYSIDFLTKWAYDENLYKNNSVPSWWDQGVLYDMYNNNILNIQENSIQYEYGELQHFLENDKIKDKTYIFHLAGKSAHSRYQTSKKYFDTLFNIKTNINSNSTNFSFTWKR